MTQKSAKDWDMYALAVAFLSSENMKQQDIADRLGITQPDVSRYHKHATKNRWLEVVPPKFHGRDRAADLWQQSEERFFTAGKILRELRSVERWPRLRNIHVFPGNAEDPFGPEAARVFEGLFKRTQYMGVTWGRTINKLVAALRRHMHPRIRAKDPVRFVPLCGEPLKERQDPLKYSSTALATELHLIVNGSRQRRPPSLAGVPAFIPLEFDDKEAEVIRRFLCSVAGYEAVFGCGARKSTSTSVALVTKLNTILTSVGVTSKRRGIFLSERVALGEISDSELMETVVGDIGGIMIPKAEVTGAKLRRIERLNRRWSGITEDDLRACAERGMADDHPGVIVLAIGEPRADMVRAIVTRGLVNELILDHELAKKLGR